MGYEEHFKGFQFRVKFKAISFQFAFCNLIQLDRRNRFRFHQTRRGVISARSELVTRDPPLFILISLVYRLWTSNKHEELKKVDKIEKTIF